MHRNQHSTRTDAHVVSCSFSTGLGLGLPHTSQREGVHMSTDQHPHVLEDMRHLALFLGLCGICGAQRVGFTGFTSRRRRACATASRHAFHARLRALLNGAS